MAFLPCWKRLSCRGKVWEVRSGLDNRIARTLFTEVDQEIVLLHGFIKKTQKTPADDLALAKKRRKLYVLNRHEKQNPSRK